MALQLSHVVYASHIPHLDLVFRADPLRFRTQRYLNSYFVAPTLYIDVLLINESKPARGLVVEQLSLSAALHDLDRGSQYWQLHLEEAATLTLVELYVGTSQGVGVPILLTREEWQHKPGAKLTEITLDPSLL